MSNVGAASRAAVPAPGAPTRVATAVSDARAEASRRNGARSRGPKTPEGRSRSAQNALRHGMRAQKFVILPGEDAAEFAALQAALFEELAPVGALQTVLARRVAVAAWRLARADRMEAEVLEFRSNEADNVGLALIRDGNGTRAVETLMRYRGAAMGEFMRALRTLKALQAEPAPEHAAGAQVGEMPPQRRRGPARAASGPAPNEPDRRMITEYAVPERAAPGRTLHEPAASWVPNEPEAKRPAGVKQSRTSAEPPLPARPAATGGPVEALTVRQP